VQNSIANQKPTVTPHNGSKHFFDARVHSSKGKQQRWQQAGWCMSRSVAFHEVEKAHPKVINLNKIKNALLLFLCLGNFDCVQLGY